MKTEKLIEAINIQKATPILAELYGTGKDTVARQKERYETLIRNFREAFGADEISLYSTPGRSEIGGNHTDHNRGRVLAAAVNLDALAAASPSGDDTIILFSSGYKKPITLNLRSLSPIKKERGTSAALIRGIAFRLRELGYQAGGFRAWVDSEVMVGSGLSSSASFEVLVGTIFNHLFNNGRIKPLELAKAGQLAENGYFGKPCGLMDQTTCAVGGIVTIDFKDAENPLVKRVDFDITKQGYRLLVVDTGGDHADLTEDYAAIPREMRAVAKALGGREMRDVAAFDLLANLPDLRMQTGDRAVLRAIHFLQENERVEKQVRALQRKDFTSFLALVRESGESSYKWLQNCYPAADPSEQGVALALALSENFIKESGEGACRVHGGGFAGTIQVFLPEKQVRSYSTLMESVFGAGSVRSLSIRQKGSIRLGDIIT